MAETNLPVVADFSPAAIRKAVTSSTLQKAYSLYPTVLGVLGVAAGVLFTTPEVAIVGLVGLMGGVGSGIVNYFFRFDAQAQVYLAVLREARQREIAERPSRIRDALSTHGFARGVEQIDTLAEKFKNFRCVLEKKFEPSEITFGRYLGMAEQVYLAALDQLEDAASMLESVRTIDQHMLDKRLNQLGYRERAPVEAGSEEASLLERRALCVGVAEKVEEIVEANEAAMTALDTTAVSIASIRTKQGRAAVDMETAMAELSRLAGRASLYKHHG